jgi:hypothetical protein
MKTLPSFWLTNISNRNVSLTDLNLTVKAYSSVNLLDKKHYQYTLEQLENSVNKGSIFRKRNKLSVRKEAPKVTTFNIPLNSETYIDSRERSLYNVKEEHYEELMLSDEDFAKEYADIIQTDEQSFHRKK